MSIEEIDNSHLYCVSLPGYTWQCGLKNTDNKLETRQMKDKIFLLESNIRRGISSQKGDRCLKSDDNKQTLYVDAIILYGWAMSHSLPYDGIKFGTCVSLEEILSTPDDSDFGFFKS